MSLTKIDNNNNNNNNMTFGKHHVQLSRVGATKGFHSFQLSKRNLCIENFLSYNLVQKNISPVAIRTALPPMYRKCPFFLLRILVNTFHEFHRNAIEHFSA